MCLNIMHDCAGWLLLLCTFSIPLMWNSIRGDTKVVHAIWFCLVLHHTVSYLNVYDPFGSSFLNVYIPDASGFHGDAVGIAELPEPVWRFTSAGFISGSIIYTHSLGFLYSTFGPSHLFGKELSVLAFALSCVVLVKLVDHLDLRRFRVGIVLLFGSLPSMVIFTSVTLREPWQALFFLLSLYWTIRLWKRSGILNSLFLLMSVLCMSMMHYGLARYAVYLVVISVYWAILSRKKNVRWARHLRFLFAGILIFCVIILTQKMGWYMSVEKALENGTVMRRHLLEYTEVRTNFSFILDTSSMLGIVTTVPMVFVEYMFAPFPWQVENVKDLWALLESILRFLLLFFAISSWRRSSGEVRSCYSFLLIAVLGMELVWALGTANWGTSVRHHVPGYGIIVLLGAPRLILFMQKLQFGIFGRGKDNTMLPK